MKKIISIMLVCMLITTISFAGTFTKSSNGSSISINVDQGKTILLKAREIFGKIFTGWTITGATVTDSSLSEQTITMGSSDVTATANYATPYTITVEQNANGVISPSTVTVAEGSSKTFTITPNTGHEIEDVKVDGVSVLSSCVAGTGDEKTYTLSGINGNKTITAMYSSTSASSSSILIMPTLTISSVTASSIKVSISAVAPNGENLVYKLYANGTLKATSNATTSGSTVNLTASGLTEMTFYSLTVECWINSSFIGSATIVELTYCDGDGASGCVQGSRIGSFNVCRTCARLVNTGTNCPRCGASLWNTSCYTCTTHSVHGWYANNSIYPLRHCSHGFSDEHTLIY